MEPGRLVQCSKCKTNFELDWHRAPQASQSRPEAVPGAVCVRCLQKEDVARCPSCSLIWHSNCAGGWPCPWCVANGGVVSPRPTAPELLAWAEVQGLSAHLQSGSEALLREVYDWAWDRLRLFWLQSQPREGTPGRPAAAPLKSPLLETVTSVVEPAMLPKQFVGPPGRRLPQVSPAPAKKTPGPPELGSRPAFAAPTSAPDHGQKPPNSSKPTEKPPPVPSPAPTPPQVAPTMTQPSLPEPSLPQVPPESLPEIPATVAASPAVPLPEQKSPQPASSIPSNPPISASAPPAQPEPSPAPSADPSPSPSPAKAGEALKSPSDSPLGVPDMSATAAKKKRARRDLANLSLGMACPYCAYGCYKEHEMLRHVKNKHPESVGKGSPYRPLKPAGAHTPDKTKQLK